MRTKSLLLMAAIAAVATAGAFAQGNVYSVNAVGYVNKSMARGFNLVANPLNAGGNTLAEVLPSVPLGSRVFKYNNGSFTIATFEEDDFGVQGWTTPTATVAPGEGFFFQNNTAAATNITFVGEVPQGTALNNPLVAGFNLKASIVPQAGQLDTTLEYPASLGDRVFKYNNASGSYQIATFEEDDFGVQGWTNPSFATLDVADGVFIFTGAAKTWTRNFSATN